MNHLPSTLEAIPLGPAIRAAAHRRAAETCREQANETISHGLGISDPDFDGSWRLRQHWLAMAEIHDEKADTFLSYALADHVEQAS